MMRNTKGIKSGEKFIDEQILIEIYEMLKKGESVTLAILTDDMGSSRRRKVSTMAVFKDGKIIGSVGGGKVEITIINQAK